MSILYQILDAAHAYGLDNMPVTPASEDAFDALIGIETDAVNSWGDGTPAPGRPESTTIFYSGGYTQHAVMTFGGNADLTLTSLELARTDTAQILVKLSGSLTVSYDAFSAGFNEPRSYFSGADKLIGNSYNNLLKGYNGDDLIDGQGGLDTAFFEGGRAGYTIGRAGGVVAVNGLNGDDRLINVERIRFDDQAVAFDIDGTAGQVYRLYQAMFDRAPDLAGLGFWISRMDAGITLGTVAAEFMRSPEFASLYGPDSGNGQFLTRLYENVLDRAPDQGGYDYWMAVLDGAAGADVRGAIVLSFSESVENQTGVAPLVGNGIPYLPYGA